MTDVREFKQTDVLVSYGYIFWTGPRRGPVRIGFMRRPQTEIHHGEASPWVMATVGGMRNKEEVLDKGLGPNAEGFMGRPPSGEEIANAQLRLKLGVKIDTEFHVPPLEGWLEATHPFYYGNSTPDVRNVGMVKRKVRRLENTELEILHNALAARNAKVKPEHVHELQFFTQDEFQTNVWFGDSSLKGGEITLIGELYDVLADKNQIHFQAEAHLSAIA